MKLVCCSSGCRRQVSSGQGWADSQASFVVLMGSFKEEGALTSFPIPMLVNGLVPGKLRAVVVCYRRVVN